VTAPGPLKTNPSGGERKLPNPDEERRNQLPDMQGLPKWCSWQKRLGSAGRGLLKKSDANASPSPRGMPTKKREVAGTLQQCGGDRACKCCQPR
jgi:hypothetical protein